MKLYDLYDLYKEGDIRIRIIFFILTTLLQISTINPETNQCNFKIFKYVNFLCAG
jgi:hypothetical protein